MLRAYVNFKMDNWDTVFPAVKFAINNGVQSSTEMSPFELDAGQSPLLPVDLLPQSNIPAVNKFVARLATSLQRAKDNLLEAQRSQALQAN